MNETLNHRDTPKIEMLFTGTSLRVAMFKRQKSQETQRFLDSLTSSKDPADSLNLQITGMFAACLQSHSPTMKYFISSFSDILDQLTDLSSSFETQ